VDEGEPEVAEGPGRERQRDLLAADDQAPGLGRVEAGEDLEQGRLARAVLAEQAVDLAAAVGQRGVVERALAAEALRDARELEQVSGRSRRDRSALRLERDSCSVKETKHVW
jgi:hypothetical protein